MRQEHEHCDSVLRHTSSRACRRERDAGAASSTLAEDLYLEFDREESPLTLDDMADTFINLLFAGHDTTAHTLARLLAELPRHPAMRDRLAQEQTAVRCSLTRGSCGLMG